MNLNPLVSHESISQRAYQIWEQSGRLHGQDAEHWLQAERELHERHPTHADPNPARGKGVEPLPAHAKHVPEQAPHTANYAHPGVTADALHHQRH